MKLYKVIFWQDEARHTAYVVATGEGDAQSKVLMAYVGCTLHSVDEWPYDMVVM